MGFELAVRLAKFAFDFPAEFPASVRKSGFGEKFAPKVLRMNIRLFSVVRLGVALRRQVAHTAVEVR
jgi:hypothetical protein